MALKSIPINLLCDKHLSHLYIIILEINYYNVNCKARILSRVLL